MNKKPKIMKKLPQSLAKNIVMSIAMTYLLEFEYKSFSKK